MKKSFFLILSQIFFQFADSQSQFKEMKTDIHLIPQRISETGPSSSLGIVAIIQMLIALLIVLGLLKYLLPKLLSRFNGQLTSNLQSSIKIEEAAHFGNGKLIVVTVRDKTLLLSATPQGISFLNDLTPQLETVYPPAFFELLDSYMQKNPKSSTESPQVAEAIVSESFDDETLKLKSKKQIKEMLNKLDTFKETGSV